jgi:fermentation-respiration switch protein FrsA (DUF1100 family)
MNRTTAQPEPPKKRNRPFILTAGLLIAAVLASYPFVINRCAFFPDRRDLLPVEQLPAGVEEIFIPTDDGERLQCYWLPRPPSDRVLLYFHGNSGNIGHRLPQLRSLADLEVNVLGGGYRGYGKSSGRPSEHGIYADGRAALRHATARLGFKPDKVILLGRSIGSTVAVEIARGQPLGGVILVTPLTSGKAMARAHGFGPLAYFAGDKFNNLRKIDQLRAPLLIIHGTADEITPFNMGERLYSQAPEPKRFVAIAGGRHNDIGWTRHNGYWDAIADFLQKQKGAAAGDH